MNNNSVHTIPLTRRGNSIRYRKHPANPEFECSLHPGMMQQLATDPAVLLRKPKEVKDFWLRVLLDSLLTRSQFVFTTSLSKQTGDAIDKTAARTLFQLDGDVLLKIDTELLKRADGISILKAHFGWTEWCLQELGRALSWPCIHRYFRWLILFLGLAASVSGLIVAPKPAGVRAGFLLPQVGLATLMLGHLFLPPTTLRYFRWLPVILGACWTILVIPGIKPSTAQVDFFDLFFAFFPLVLGALSGLAGGRILRPLVRGVTNFVVKRRTDRALREYANAGT